MDLQNYFDKKIRKETDGKEKENIIMEFYYSFCDSEEFPYSLIKKWDEDNILTKRAWKVISALPSLVKNDSIIIEFLDKIDMSILLFTRELYK